MFRINDYVNYDIYGICQIEDIRPHSFDSMPATRDYYILRPLAKPEATVFVPTDNERALGRMRRVLTAAEVDEAIENARDQKLGWISNRKDRLARFNEILLQRDESELLSMIYCLLLHERDSHKALSSTEAQMLKKAEHIIDQEFSFSLNLRESSIGAYVRARIGAEL